jgi:hypothetical protein
LLLAGIETLGHGHVAIVQFAEATILSAGLDNNGVADIGSRALHGLELSVMHLFAMAQIAGYAAGGAYLKTRVDPGFAWELSARSVASLFGFCRTASPNAVETLVLTGDRDKAIPAWATRFFMW